MVTQKAIPDTDSSECFSPLNGNTGVILESGVLCLHDWLRGSMSGDRLNTVFEMIQRYWGFKPIKQDKSKRWYRQFAVGIHSLEVCWEPTTNNGRSEMLLDIPGKALAALDPETQRQLFKELKSYDFRPTRIDIAVRDYTKTLCPVKAYEAAKSGFVRGFQKHGFYESSDKEFGYGATASFGSRGSKGSGKYLRIYNKYVESKGRDNCFACELELTDHKAKAYWKMLVDSDDVVATDIWAQFIASHIKGAIQFIDCPWWDAIFNDIQKMKLPAKKKNKVQLDKMISWIEKQVAPTLSCVIDYFAVTEFFDTTIPVTKTRWFSYLVNLLNFGRKRQNDNHLLAIAESLA